MSVYCGVAGSELLEDFLEGFVVYAEILRE
jgi:hypothetical protein